MKKLHIVFLIILTVLLSTLANYLFLPHQPATQKTETAYQRVMRTGILRCGYFSWSQALRKNPNTGALEGIFYDYTNALGKSLSLKIEWAEEIGLGDFPAALESGRIDAFCSGTYITGARARSTGFVTPLYYSPLYAFARTDDNRFGDDFSLMNDQKYTMAVLEGGATSTIQKQLFAQTKVYELPQLVSPAELFSSLAQGKADIVVYDLFTYGDYSAHNPGKIKRISSHPVKVFPLAIGVKPDEDRLREMLSSATLEMQLSGAIDKIIKQRKDSADAVYQVTPPYQR